MGSGQTGFTTIHHFSSDQLLQNDRQLPSTKNKTIVTVRTFDSLRQLPPCEPDTHSSSLNVCRSPFPPLTAIPVPPTAHANANMPIPPTHPLPDILSDYHPTTAPPTG